MTEQNPEQTSGQLPQDPATQPVVTDPPAAQAPADVAVPQDQPAPAEKTPPAVGDLCTFATEDEAGFTSLTTCLVVEVFTEPDENGKDVQLARVAVLPDERIVQADRLEHRS